MDAIPITKKLIAFGSKKIYLPKFTVALVRSPKLSPYHARFLVPLDFSKYDLRDYLYHAYNVRCFNVRSYIKQMPVRDARVQPRHWFREDSKKYMTVEMEQPFVWPEVPDLAPWSPAARQKEFEDSETMSGATNHEMQRESARDLRKKVEMLFKREQPLSNDAIARKKEAGLELTPAEKATEEQRLAKEARLQAMSRIKMWEAQRSVKVVESDERSKFTIKA